jgi:hypothetical protein
MPEQFTITGVVLPANGDDRVGMRVQVFDRTGEEVKHQRRKLRNAWRKHYGPLKSSRRNDEPARRQLIHRDAKR